MGQEAQPGVASWKAGHGNDEASPLLPREVWPGHYGNREGAVTKQMTCALRVRFEEQRTIKLDGEVGRR